MFLKELFEKVNFEKKSQQTTTKAWKITLCKQFGPRSGLIKCWSWSGSMPFDTLKVILQEICEKFNFEKSQQTIKKAWKITQHARQGLPIPYIISGSAGRWEGKAEIWREASPHWPWKVKWWNRQEKRTSGQENEISQKNPWVGDRRGMLCYYITIFITHMRNLRNGNALQM